MVAVMGDDVGFFDIRRPPQLPLRAAMPIPALIPPGLGGAAHVAPSLNAAVGGGGQAPISGGAGGSTSMRRGMLSLEDAAIECYLSYLEAEAVSYIGLTQSDSQILRNVAVKMMQLLKHQVNCCMSGIASSSIRQKMLRIILSDRFPSPHYRNVYVKNGPCSHQRAGHEGPSANNQPDAMAVDEAAAGLGVGGTLDDSEHFISSCPNTCCTGAFIKETMAGVIMSADIRELVFTNGKIGRSKSGADPTSSCLAFNVPVVLTHLLSATHEQYSQLERLVFSESFVEDPVTGDSDASNRMRLLHHHEPHVVMEHLYRKQERFTQSFAAVITQDDNGCLNSFYCSPDRKGLAFALLVMFRVVVPRPPQPSGGFIGFHKLTEIVLKNNVQCELYSKANFQFELLARIGFSCPRLRVLDLFGTDTWADCLVAFFFRDAFHSLHRYLFFMENEEDEDSAYHPHDLTRYCQFCLDRLHPVSDERPFTINPVIPLIDPIYDHVIKKYPKRSFCILRNCVKVSDLIASPKSTVFELLRPSGRGWPSGGYGVELNNTCPESKDSGEASNASDGVCSNASLDTDPLSLVSRTTKKASKEQDVGPPGGDSIRSRLRSSARVLAESPASKSLPKKRKLCLKDDDSRCNKLSCATESGDVDGTAAAHLADVRTSKACGVSVSTAVKRPLTHHHTIQSRDGPISVYKVNNLNNPAASKVSSNRIRGKGKNNGGPSCSVVLVGENKRREQRMRCRKSLSRSVTNGATKATRRQSCRLMEKKLKSLENVQGLSRQGTSRTAPSSDSKSSAAKKKYGDSSVAAATTAFKGGRRSANSNENSGHRSKDVSSSSKMEVVSYGSWQKENSDKWAFYHLGCPAGPPVVGAAFKPHEQCCHSSNRSSQTVATSGHTVSNFQQSNSDHQNQVSCSQKWSSKKSRKKVEASQQQQQQEQQLSHHHDAATNSRGAVKCECCHHHHALDFAKYDDFVVASSSYTPSSNWTEPKQVKYREIKGWPHLNDCTQTLEVLNIGGTNVLGEFIPFILLYTPRLKSLGQWINTMIYGLEILRSLQQNSGSAENDSGREAAAVAQQRFPQIVEFSYSTDRNYFCQPYIGFVPESAEYRNVRREMVRQSGRVAKRLGHSARNHAAKRQQIQDDVELMVDACPNVQKLNLVLHHKLVILHDNNEVDLLQRPPPLSAAGGDDPSAAAAADLRSQLSPWGGLTRWTNLNELDLVTMRFANVRSLLRVVGSKLHTLTLEMTDEQGTGSEIVHIARHCPELRSLRLLIGDKVLRGEMTLHFGTQFFRKLERLVVEGSVHLHGFAFLWGHCRNLKYMCIGNVVSNEVLTSNVLIYDVFALLFQVNKMVHLEEMHIKNLKIRSFQMGQFLLENLPKLTKASNWLLDLYGEDMVNLKKLIKSLRVKRGLSLEYRDW